MLMMWIFPFNQWDLVVRVHSFDAGGFWGFLLVVMVCYLYDCFGGWKFPHMNVWVLTVIRTHSCGCLNSRLPVWDLETFTKGNLPDSLNRLMGFFSFFDWGVLGSVHACRVFFNIPHIVSSKYSGINPLFSLLSSRSALQKSLGRMQQQRAGGPRRASRSGCWRGWPWWPGSWWAHWLLRSACERKQTTALLLLLSHDPLHLPPSLPSTYTPQKLKWRSCLSCQNCW